MILNRLVAISFTMAVGASAFAGQSWDLATDFSTTVNPNGAWSYGQIIGSSFSALTAGGTDYEIGGVQAIYKNTNSVETDGVGANQIGMNAKSGTPAVRWTAPTSGFYDITVSIGGSTLISAGGGEGNGYVTSSSFDIGGVSQTPTSSTNTTGVKEKDWSYASEFLAAGTTLDAITTDPGQPSGPDMQTKMHIAALPEPAPFAALGLGALGLLIRRRKNK